MEAGAPGPSRLRVLGPIEIDQRDETTRLRGQQALLFAHLVAQFPQPVSTGALEAALWGDRPPASVDTALRVAITRLRKKIGKDTIRYLDSGYQLAVQSFELDSAVFEQLVERADASIAAADWDSAEEAVDRALAMWRGSPFANLADTFSLEPAVRRLVDRYARAQEIAVDLDMRAGRFEKAASAADLGSRNDPFRERRQEQLMLALHLCGRTVEALRVFQQYRTYLADEVGLTPGESITALEAAIVQDHPLDRWKLASPERSDRDNRDESPIARSAAVDLARKATLP